MRKLFLCLSILLAFNLLSSNVKADLIDDGGFFDDFEPADIIITSGSTLTIRNGGTLELQAGSTFSQAGDQAVQSTSNTAFQVQTNAGATTIFLVDTDTTGDQHVTVSMDTDNATAFIVEDAADQDIFVVDTVAGGITVNTDGGGASFVVADAQIAVTTNTDAATGFIVEDIATGQDIFVVDTLAGGDYSKYRWRYGNTDCC